MIGYEELISDYRTIYADFLKLCRRARPSNPWGRFKKKADFDCWRPPTDEKAALTALQEKHCDKDLIRSGIVIENLQRELELSPMFFEISTAIVPLRSNPQGKPFDLLTAQGTITGRLPMHRACQDHLTLKEINARGFVLAEFSIQDVMSLRAIELPVALTVGMEEFTPGSMQEFRNAFHLSASSSLLQSPQLILVGWTPSRLSRTRPEALDRVVRNIAITASCHGMALDTVLVWQPDAAEIQALARCLEIGRRKAVVDAILTSLDQSTEPLAPPTDAQEPFSDFLETGTRLKNALLRKSSRSQRKKRWRDHERASGKLLVNPLFQLAAIEPDIERRSRLMALARVHQVLHPNVTVHLARLEQEIAQRGLRGDWTSLDIKGLMKAFDTLYKLTKEGD